MHNENNCSDPITYTMDSSSIDNEAVSGRVLLSMLCKDLSAQELSDKWMQATNDDWRAREQHIVELMFLSAGWDSFSYDLFLERDISSHLFSKDLIKKSPAMDSSFLEKFSELMKLVFFQDDLLFDEDKIKFFQTVSTAVVDLCGGPWTSCRTVGVIAGLKILTFYHSANKIFGDKLADAREQGNSNVVDEYEALTVQLFDLWKNLYQTFFVKAVRDVVSNIRELVFIEMVEWAKINPLLLLSTHWHKFIVFGLHDKPQFLHTLKVLKTILDKKRNVNYQQNLLDKTLKILVSRLIEKGPVGCMAMEVLVSAAQFLEVKCSSKELEYVYMCVYNPDRAIAINAAKYVFVTRLKGSAQHPEILLRELIIFNSEAAFSSEELLVDSFYLILTEFVEWEHWPKLFYSCQPQLTVSAAKLFVNYVKKATTNFCPANRNKVVASKKSTLQASNSFTSFFGKNWQKIMSIDKIKFNPHALGIIVGSICYLNRKLSPNDAWDVVEHLVELLMNTPNPVLICCCWPSLAFLKDNVSWDLQTKLRLNAKFESLKSNIMKEFGEFLNLLGSGLDFDCVQSRVLGLAKYDRTDLNHLWETCINKLESDLSSSNDALVRMMVKVLRNLFFCQYNYFNNSEFSRLNDSSTSESSVASWDQELVQLSCRQSALQELLIELLSDNRSLENRILAFDILVDIITCFGPHMIHHPTLWSQAMPVASTVQHHVVDFACEAMSWNRVHVEGERNPCCEVLSKVCKLFSVAYIDIMMLKELLALTGDVAVHDKIVLFSLKRYSDRFSKKYSTISLVIFQALAMKIKNRPEVNQQGRASQSSVASIFKATLEQWKQYSSFLAVLNLAGVSTTIQIYLDKLMISLGAELLTDLLSSTRERPKAVQRESQESSASDKTEDAIESYSGFAGKTGIGHSTMCEAARPKLP